VSVDVSVINLDYCEATMASDAMALLDALDLGECELSVVLCDDVFIAGLNGTYRDKNKPTDVLSFAQREGECGQSDDPILGDVIISVETAGRQASDRGHSLAREVRVLLVHGVLHLLGYDHVEDAEALVMEDKERVLLDLLDGLDGLPR